MLATTAVVGGLLAAACVPQPAGVRPAPTEVTGSAAWPVPSVSAPPPSSAADPTGTEPTSAAPPASQPSGPRAEQVDAGIEVASVPALPAQAFTDSVCVGTHWAYPDTPYGAEYDEVSRLLVASGIRHVRDGGSTAATRSAVQDLATRGVRTTYVLDPNQGVVPDGDYWSNPDTDRWAIDDMLTDELGVGAVDAVEIGNEWDLFYCNVRARPESTDSLSSLPIDGGNGYREYAEALTCDTRATLDANPATADVPVVGPSYTNGGDYREPGSLEPWVDHGNVHAYQAGRHPESLGWGADGYGSRGWQLDNARAQAPTGSAVVTEGGYSNAVDQNTQNTPEDVTGRYLPRLFLHYFDGGFDRFCSYEFLDEWPNPERDNNEANFGMLRNDLSPKPSYLAVQNMMRVLADPAASADTGSMRYAVSDPAVEQLLVREGDGSHVLALWLGEQSWDPVNGGRTDVADRSVTVQLPDATSATAHRLDDTGAMSTAPVALDGGAAALQVGDEVTFVEIR